MFYNPFWPGGSNDLVDIVCYYENLSMFLSLKLRYMHCLTKPYLVFRRREMMSIEIPLKETRKTVSLRSESDAWGRKKKGRTG